MEGFTLLRTLKETLSETDSGTFMNDRTSYDNLYYAIQDFNFKTHYLTATQTISVVAGVSSYDLSPDFVTLSLIDSYNRPYIKHTYGGVDSFIYSRDYSNVVLENSTGTSTIASSFSITDSDQPSNITGTATSNGTASNGECILTDSTAPFTNVSAGDFVHNTTDGSDGIVVSKTSSSQISCALFEGTANQWSTNDAYIIIPQPRYKLVLSPIPSDVATLTIVYVQRPNPVYSSFRAYKLPFNYVLPIVQFAAFLYKYRDREPNFGDNFYKYYDGFTRKIATEMRRGIEAKQGMRVNFTKINSRSRSTNNWSS
jgi:hypothetical protein